jgi:serine protease Do
MICTSSLRELRLPMCGSAFASICKQLVRWSALVLLGQLLSAAALPVSVQAQEAPSDPPAQATPREPFLSVEALVKHVKPAVVVITMSGREGEEQGLGTGFVISRDGLIATNLHVIGESRPIAVHTHDGRRLEVTEVYASDRHLDLAIVRVKANDLQPLAVGDSDAVAQGEQLVLLGNPRGLRHSVVTGVLSGTREIEGRNMLQLAMPIEPGNSGGPVLNMRGQVLGVVTMKSALTENLGFAVAGNALKPLLDKPNSVPMERWLKIGSLDPKRWQPLAGGRWEKRGGRIVVSGAGEGVGQRSLCLWQASPPEPPYEVATWVKLGNESGAAGLVFCSDGKDQHYGFYPSGGRLRLSRFEGPDVFSWNVLEEAASEHYQTGEWNHLKVRVEKDRLRCFVNDRQVFESADRTFTHGRVGLAKFRDTEAEFRRFQLAAEIPPAALSDQVIARARTALEKLPPLADVTPEALAELSGAVVGQEEDSASSPVQEVPQQAAEAIAREAKELRKRAEELDRIATSVRRQGAIAQLAELIKPDSNDLDLLRACLIVARLDGEEIDVEEYVDTVDHMAREIEAKFDPSADDAARLAALNKYLFEENGFHGSRTDYYHRANSYLSRVIDDREGLPITLSILYMELAERLGLKVVGVGLPGHFIVQHVPDGGEPQLIDPFEGGEQLTRDDAAAKVQAFAQRSLDESDLVPPTKKTILIRVLSNLLGVAQQRADREAMLGYLDAMLTVDPQLAPQRGMRAIVRHETGRRAAAIRDLDWFLEHQPQGVELEKIRELRELFQKASAP